MKFGTPIRSNHAIRCAQAHSRSVWSAVYPTAFHATAAFTLAEVLAALVFMAIVIPVALWALGISSRVGEVAARRGEAALVAERILNESIVTTNWNRSV